MARTKKTAETTEIAKPKRGRPPKTAIVAATETPKKRGRPPKQAPIETDVQPAAAQKGTKKAALSGAVTPDKVKAAASQKPGLVSMAPATKARASRVAAAKPTVKKTEAKVAAVQQEQILAEELHEKVMQSEAPVRKPGRPPKAIAQPAPAEKKPATLSRTAAKKARVVSEPPVKVRSRRRRKMVFAVLAVIVLAGCAAGGYTYKTHRPVEAAQTADQALLAAVSKRVLVPSDETPSISTVVDAAQVNQPFLEGAQNGDKVLLYFQAGRAIVYRPSTGQVVNMGSLQQPEPQVFIRKGSPDANTSKIASTITASKEFTVDSQDTSPLNSYAKTIVVDVAGNRPDVAKKLADLLHATVAPLPQGETPPDADLLVIVGSDTK